MRSVTIVGGSLAGLRAATALRREGFDGTVRIISQEDRLPIDRPPLSKQVLAGKWEPDKVALHGADEADAEWVFGRSAVGLDVAATSVSLDDGSVVDGDAVVIACGVTPRRLPPAVLAPDTPDVYELRTVEDCLTLREALRRSAKVVVVGAGFIGSEVASTARDMGIDVTVVEMLPIPLQRALGDEMGKRCAQLQRDHGVDLRLGVGVQTIQEHRVVLDDGTALEADAIVVGVGVTPATRWLEDSGLELRDGVVCDERCVAAPGIVAAGDIARWRHAGYDDHIRVEHWTNASEQGAAAAESLLRGTAAAPYAPIPYFWSDQFGTKIQLIGHNRADDEVAIVEGSPDEGRFVAAYSRAGTTTAVLLWNRPSRLAHWMNELSSSEADLA